VTVVAAAAYIAFAAFSHGAIVAPTAAVVCFTPRADLTPTIAVANAPIVSAVAFAASARANDNSRCYNFEKPLDVLLEEEMEM